MCEHYFLRATPCICFTEPVSSSKKALRVAFVNFIEKWWGPWWPSPPLLTENTTTGFEHRPLIPQRATSKQMSVLKIWWVPTWKGGWFNCPAQRFSTAALLTFGARWPFLEGAARCTVGQRQERDGPQARHLPLASCLHFMGQEKVGFRPDTYN